MHLENLPTHSNGLSKAKLESQNIRFKTAIIMLFNTGLRKEELFGLKWKDINNKTNVIEIRRAVISTVVENFHPDDIIEQIKKQLICKDLKTPKSRRNIVIPKICLDLLNAYKENQISNGKNVIDEDYVFQTLPLDCVWNPDHLTKEWKNFVDKNELKKITVHDIRHSHATYLLSIGIPLQDVSRRIGHSDVGTTLKVYTHSNLEQDKKITNQLEQNLYENYNISKESGFDFSVIASITTGVNFTDEENIYNCLEYLTNYSINESNYDSARKICKNYILEKYNELENIGQFINENTSKEINDIFFKLVNKDYKVDPILEIDKDDINIGMKL